MKAELWNVIDELDFCVDYLKEVAAEAEALYDRGAIDKTEFYARVRWHWYNTTARIMDESFKRNMPMREED